METKADADLVDYLAQVACDAFGPGLAPDLSVLEGLHENGSTVTVKLLHPLHNAEDYRVSAGSLVHRGYLRLTRLMFQRFLREAFTWTAALRQMTSKPSKGQKRLAETEVLIDERAMPPIRVELKVYLTSVVDKCCDGNLIGYASTPCTVTSRCSCSFRSYIDDRHPRLPQVPPYRQKSQPRLS